MNLKNQICLIQYLLQKRQISNEMFNTTNLIPQKRKKLSRFQKVDTFKDAFFAFHKKLVKFPLKPFVAKQINLLFFHSIWPL